MKVFEVVDNIEKAYYAALDESQARQEADFNGFETIGHIRELKDEELDMIKIELTDENEELIGVTQTLREYIAAEMYTNNDCPRELCVMEL